MLGTGLIKGLLQTGKNFVGSYHDPERLVTVQYPEEKVPPKENNRNFPFLVFDGNDPHAGLRCVACQICEKECPPQCIYIIKSKDKKPDYVGKPQIYPATFDIDISVCMSCQICVEVCPFEAIKMDQVFELSTSDRFARLLLDKNELAKPNTYFHELHPTEAAEIDARLAEEKKKAEAKADAEAKAKAAAAAPAKAAITAPASPATTPAPVPASAPSTRPPGPEAAAAVNAQPTEPPGPAKVNPNPAESSMTNATTAKVESTPPMAPPQPAKEPNP
jgi:NADH-quinone oxidoreductase subunit I